MGMLNRWGADQMLNKKEYFEVLPELLGPSKETLYMVVSLCTRWRWVVDAPELSLGAHHKYMLRS